MHKYADQKCTNIYFQNMNNALYAGICTGTNVHSYANNYSHICAKKYAAICHTKYARNINFKYAQIICIMSKLDICNICIIRLK